EAHSLGVVGAVLLGQTARRPVRLGGVASTRAVQGGDVLERNQDVPVQLHVRDVFEVAVRGQHAVLVLAAEEGDLDLLTLVLVCVVLHATSRRTYPIGAVSRSSRKWSSITPQFSIGWNGSSLAWERSARIVPPCETIRMRSPVCARAIRSTVCRTRARCCSRVSPSGRSLPGKRSSISSRVSPDHEPTSISRSPGS